VYEERDEEPMKRLPHPAYVFGFIALIALVVTIRDLKRKKATRWFDLILFVVVGLVGVLLTLLWFTTDHRAAAKNFNLLWALPTHFPISILLIKNYKWIRYYFLFTFILSIILLLSWSILPQELNLSLIPMVIVLGLRSFCQYWIRKSKS
jgi:hypothetical protein